MIHVQHNWPMGILVPMQEEVELLLEQVEHPEKSTLASRVFYKGTISGKPVVLAKSGIGKVASSFTAALLIEHFKAAAIMVTGVAGGIAEGIKVGDFAIARSCVQHDMDCRPLFPKFEVPLSSISYFKTDPFLTVLLEKAAHVFIEKDFPTVIAGQVLSELGITTPKVHSGLLASGDQFIGTFAQWEIIRNELPDALFVEMEGAAVAQVCFDCKVPLCSIRTISDKANASAHVDFNAFLNHAAKVYTAGIVKRFMELV